MFKVIDNRLDPEDAKLEREQHLRRDVILKQGIRCRLFHEASECVEALKREASSQDETPYDQHQVTLLSTALDPVTHFRSKR